MEKNTNTKHVRSTKSSLLFDAFCAASILGIWPRFIEPRLLRTSTLSLKVPRLPDALVGTKIVQISDIHINDNLSDSYLKKITQKVNALKPDIITITGDLICYSKLNGQTKRLEAFLNSLKATHGHFVILGNHDYANYVTVGSNGDYVVDEKTKTPYLKAFKRILKVSTPTKYVTEAARNTPMYKDLTLLFENTPFTLLHNKTIQTVIHGKTLNITGLGEYTLSKTIPSLAFEKYQRDCPGIILLHNPDGIRLLKDFPGDIVLCGHTHGCQVNVPWLWKRLTLLENLEYKSGLFFIDEKWVYINRGIGGTMPFRWFATPEILFLTLEASS